MTQRDWPGEVARAHVYGNFRPERDYRSRQARAAERATLKHAKREGNSEEYLRLIRRLPCTSCGTTNGIQPHHLKSGKAADTRGVGQRSPDCWAVALCIHCHADLERHSSRSEPSWFAVRGWRIHRYAEKLWEEGKIGGERGFRAMWAIYRAHSSDAHQARLAAARQRQGSAGARHSQR